MEEEKEFIQRLLATFRVEAQEHVAALTAGLLKLENAPDAERALIVEEIFREAHSLKGAARSVNLLEIEALCQKLENIFAALKREERKPDAKLLDELYRETDRLTQLIEGQFGAAEKLEGNAAPSRVPQAEQKDEKLQPPETTPTFVRSSPGTVRISAAALDALLLQTEELLSAKLSTREIATNLERVRASLAGWRKEWGRARADLLSKSRRSTMGGEENRVTEFLRWNEAFIHTLDQQVTSLAQFVDRDSRNIGGMVDALLRDMKEAVMLPFGSILDGIRRQVRDLAREQDKQVELISLGEETQMDRRILEALKDPLLHLARNSVDHGLESPQRREQNGKPRGGKLVLEASRIDGMIRVIVRDDGAGIDFDRVKQAAIDSGLLTQREAGNLSPAEQSGLIFNSGVSTSAELTEISGRGLGLAIVKEKVEALGGSVSVSSTVGIGTTFTLLVPLTLTTFRGIVVKVGEQLYVIPTTQVERVRRLDTGQIKTFRNQETVNYSGKILPLIRLSRVLGIESELSDRSKTVSVLILRAGGKLAAFAVDQVLHDQDVLLKGLGRQLRRVRYISGATVLGNGKLVLVLSVTDLMKVQAQFERTHQDEIEKSPTRTHRILVADDSITSRTLLKNILESNGYRVETAVDGMEALDKVRSGNFSLVISDVEMPRMTGFELTQSIRASEGSRDLPVVLVTALGSAVDRDRGLDVGANAYIVKSSFDQSNLLEVVGQLI